MPATRYATRAVKLATFLSLILLTLFVFQPFPLSAQAPPAQPAPTPSDPAIAAKNEECMACHSDKSQTMKRNGKTVSIFVDQATIHRTPHKNMACDSCHVGVKSDEIPHQPKTAVVSCLSCHKNAPSKHPVHEGMIPTGSPAEADASCKNCHGGHDVNLNGATACGECHDEAKNEYIHSIHAKASAAGKGLTPGCLSCHHTNIVSSTEGQNKAEVKVAQAKVCESCHLDDPAVKAAVGTGAGFIASYEKSAHGAALFRGVEHAPNCADCHGSHEVKMGADPTGAVSRSHIVETCGKCHGDITKSFNQSVHGVAAAKGLKDAPVCTDCHGEHSILPPTDPRSPVAPQNVSQQTCAKCHSSVAMSEKYGIASDRFQTFEDSFHGLALKGGSVSAANCASCHGVHNIKPSSDPGSTIHPSNLVNTCGSCHPGANVRFATGKIHVSGTRASSPVIYWLSTIYLIAIILIVGGMAGHNILDFRRRAQRHMALRHGTLKEETHGAATYVRMTLSERMQHFLLAFSFIVLAITGFMLRYPDSWWVVIIREMSAHAFDLRSALHRAAAVVMVLVSVYHLYYAFFTQRGRQFIRDMFPRKKDIGDATGTLRYYLGASAEKPKYDRFSYIEKAEYWALVWGSIVMTFTGFVLWFENESIGLLTKLGWDISRTVHFWEAWLAVLAIIVWHLYYVIFNPDAYPMNTAWYTGHVTEKEMAEEHPLELERLKSDPDASAGTDKA